MFSVNERLTGRKFEYDGNPHDFGPEAGPDSYATFVSAVESVEEEKCPSPGPLRQSAASSPFGYFQFDAVDIMAVVT
ncbi:unnamed protein product [Peronospora belbahrii]|uniref:Uncharacterized protein n=1 Tax=Peronospora belbahrii TaxID=622444 RepID=A0AAU9L079_9STRA|nr:unnamed protein product [Peronospora belbahrii]